MSGKPFIPLEAARVHIRIAILYDDNACNLEVINTDHPIAVDLSVQIGSQINVPYTERRLIGNKNPIALGLTVIRN